MRILLIAALFWLMSSPSMAAGHCAPFELYGERLETIFQEVPVAMGQLFNGGFITVFAVENGSWTMLAINSQGIACMIASGQDWQMIPQTDPPIEGRDI